MFMTMLNRIIRCPHVKGSWCLTNILTCPVNSKIFQTEIKNVTWALEFVFAYEHANVCFSIFLKQAVRKKILCTIITFCQFFITRQGCLPIMSPHNISWHMALDLHVSYVIYFPREGYQRQRMLWSTVEKIQSLAIVTYHIYKNSWTSREHEKRLIVECLKRGICKTFFEHNRFTLVHPARISPSRYRWISARLQYLPC